MIAEWKIQITYEGWLFAVAVGQLILLVGVWIYMTWRGRWR
jgi:hypothetical protein